MSQAIRSRAKIIAWTLMLVYFASYVTRINFAVIMVKICSDMSLEKTVLAIVVTGLTVTYGAGQVVSGFLGDKLRAEWMPFYMQETFRIPEENAIISTVILAVFSIISFAFFDFLHRKLLPNEVFCSAVIFGASAVCSAVLYFADAANAPAVVPMLFMGIVVACMHGINLMLITVVPKRFVRSGRVATYSGLFNAFTYIGAAISTYGFAALAERFGWGVTILSWVIVSLVGMALCLFATPLWKRFRREYAD